MSDQQIVVNLTLYKGKEILKNEAGKISNEHQTMKVVYKSFEWLNLLKNLPYLGFGRVVVDRCTDKDGKKVDTPTEVVNEINRKLKAETEKAMTPEQKTIAELQARLAALESGASGIKEKIESKEEEKQAPPPPADNELHAEYEALFGKKPHHKWADETIKEKIDEYKAAQK